MAAHIAVHHVGLPVADSLSAAPLCTSYSQLCSMLALDAALQPNIQYKRMRRALHAAMQTVPVITNTTNNSSQPTTAI